MKKIIVTICAAVSLSACAALGIPVAEREQPSAEDYSDENCDLYGTCPDGEREQ